MSDKLEAFIGWNTDDGKPVRVDLSRGSSIVAGFTGSGKSNVLSLLLSRLIVSHSPKKLEYFLGDPKLVELNLFKYCPHTKMIVNSAEEHLEMLEKLCQIMDARYAWMQERDIRSVEDTFLSRIIIAIDELSDILLAPGIGKRITFYLTRLVQLGRAAGITCLLATQHPVAKVISSTIKANAPIRIALRVVSKSSSFVVLDQGGAEKLKKPGQILLMDPYSGNELIRVAAPLLTDDLIKDQIRAANYTYGNPRLLEQK